METTLISRYRQKSNSNYTLNVLVQEDGRVVFCESYDYPAQGDTAHREYKYYLTIRKGYIDVFVSLLQKRLHVTNERVHENHTCLVELLKKIVDLGQFERIDTIRGNLKILEEWLKDEKIPYQLSAHSSFG